jgi:hypothetical protein
MNDPSETTPGSQEMPPSHGIEKRRHPRYSIRLPLLHKAESSGADRAEMGWTHNMGEGGACVELAERLQPQGPIRVRLQTAKGAIELETKLIWSRQTDSAGGGILHGMAFLQIAPEQLEHFRELLLSEGSVRHAGVRWPLEISVTCQPQDQLGPPVQGRTGDIGRGGLLLRLPEALPPGTRLEVTLHAPQEPLTVSGEVVWVEAAERRTPGELIGHGLRFTSLGRSLSTALGSLLAEPL